MSNEKEISRNCWVFISLIPVYLGCLSSFYRLGTTLCGPLTLMEQFMACWMLQSMAILNRRQITMFVPTLYADKVLELNAYLLVLKQYPTVL